MLAMWVRKTSTEVGHQDRRARWQPIPALFIAALISVAYGLAALSGAQGLRPLRPPASQPWSRAYRSYSSRHSAFSTCSSFYEVAGSSGRMISRQSAAHVTRSSRECYRSLARVVVCESLFETGVGFQTHARNHLTHLTANLE